MDIAKPRYPCDHPDRALQCQEALEHAFQELAEHGEQAGWDDDEVAVALLNVANNHLVAHACNKATDAMIKWIRRGGGG